MNVVIVLLCTILFACNKDADRMKELVASAPVMTHGLPDCGFSISDAYKPAYSTWAKSKSLKYAIMYPEVARNGQLVKDYFNKSDKAYIDNIIKQAAERTSYIIKKDITKVENEKNADFIISWEFIINDGRGGKYADSSFPPVEGQLNKPKIIMDLADLWQVVIDRDKSTKINLLGVTKHEFGHIVGALQHDDCYCIMNTAYRYPDFQIDDVVGMKVQYKLFENFKWNGKDYTWISDNGKQQTADFLTKEFLSKCSYSYDDGHFLNIQVINAVQYIRTHYDCPIKILSSYRNKSCNRAAKGASMSQHLFMDAIDFKFIGKNAVKAQRQWEYDVINQLLPLQSILLIGVRGIGTYPFGIGTNHIDTRSNIYDKRGNAIYNRTSSGIKYTVWGEFKNKGSWYNWEQEYKEYD